MDEIPTSVFFRIVFYLVLVYLSPAWVSKMDRSTLKKKKKKKKVSVGT